MVSTTTRHSSSARWPWISRSARRSTPRTGSFQPACRWEYSRRDGLSAIAFFSSSHLTSHDLRLTTGDPVTDQQQATGNPLDQLREAHGVFLEVLSNVRPEQMSLPTPDDEWDVRALINHVVLGNTWAAENVRTGSAPRRPSGDIIGDREPLEAYTASADAMMASF